MTTSTLLSGPAGPYIALFFFLLAAGQLYNTAMARTLGVPAWQQALGGALLAAELLLCAVVILVLLPEGTNVSVLLGRLPAAALPAAALALAPLGVWTALHLRTWRLRHVTPLAVKESMDRLPVAICFCDAAGVPVMTNLAMDRLCAALIGETPVSVTELWTALTAHSVQDADYGAPILRTADGRVLRVRRRTLPSAYTEIAAADITELYEAMRRLHEENARLEAMKRRFVRYGEEAAEVTRQQEILAAKIAVHDDVGHVLLATKHCLDEPGSSDPAQIAELWRKTLGLFRSGAVPDREPDAAATLIRAARDVGVEAVVDGTLPSERVARNIVLDALHETITNTLRHAHGTALRLTVRETGGGWRVTLVNNGDTPTGPIEETGGLKLLRQMTEAGGGTMEIALRPAFTLCLTLPKGDEP